MKVMIKGIFILTLLVFSIRVAHAAEERPQFVFTDENIASWEETEQGFSIQLTPEAQKEFFNLTKENLNKQFYLYVEDIFVSAPVVREPIGSGRTMLAFSEEVKDKIRSSFPAEKEIESTKNYPPAKELAELVIELDDKAMMVIHEQIKNQNFYAYNLVKEKAEKNDLKAIMAMAKMTSDKEEAAPWLKKAAEMGSTEAEMLMGSFYAQGIGVKKNEAKAFEYGSKAAHKGHDVAQKMLASYYRDGIGVKKDDVEAYAWFNANLCIAMPANELPNNSMFAKELSETELKEAKMRACEHYEKYVSPFISDEEKQQTRALHARMQKALEEKIKKKND